MAKAETIESKTETMLNDLAVKASKTSTHFWKAIIHDTMDVYSLATAVYVFLVILPIVNYELRRDVPKYVPLEIAGVSLGEIPMALQIVLVGVILTTLVNYFRKILDVGTKWLDNKANG